jgi:hypothetical protein
LLELLDLGGDHKLAVWLKRVIGKVFLVVVFGKKEVCRWLQGGDNWTWPGARRVEFGNHLFGFMMLVFRGVEDHRAILRAHVVALAVQRGGIMNGKENFEQVAIAQLARIESDPHHLGMAGCA